MDRNVKVLLVSLLKNSHRNMSVLSLFASLKETGKVDTQVLFIPNEQEYNEKALQNFVLCKGYELVGISMMTDGFYFANKITKDIKQTNPNIKVIYGGIHPTLKPIECLPYADYVCIGEGENVILEVVKNLNNPSGLRNIDGLGYTINGGYVIHRPKKLIESLDSLPFVKYDWDNFYVMKEGKVKQFDHEVYCSLSSYNGEDYTIMNSRSCPYSCSYCCNTALHELYGNKGKTRRRSPENVIAELQYAIGYIKSIKFINFMDEQFLASREWVKKFSDLYKENIHLPFIIQAVPNTVDDNAIKDLKNAGLKFAVIGIQSGSERINREIFNRGFKKEQIIKASEILSKNGIHAYYDLIIQNEFEEEKDKEYTIRLLAELHKPYSLTFYALTPFPMTELEKMYKSYGKTPKINPYEQSYKDYDTDDWYYRLCAIAPFVPGEVLLDYLIDKDDARVRKFINHIYEMNVSKPKKLIAQEIK